MAARNAPTENKKVQNVLEPIEVNSDSVREVEINELHEQKRINRMQVLMHTR